MSIRVQLEPWAYMPKQAHQADAGYDLRSPVRAEIPAGGSALIDTGVHMEIPHGFCGVLVSKSGLNVSRSITSTGLIDEGYTGRICVKLYNHSKNHNYIVHKGDKISQIVILPCRHDEIEVVKQIGGGERGDGGFGSTGR